MRGEALSYGKLLGVAVGVTALVGLSALVTGGFARSKDDSSAHVAQAKQRGFVFACPQRRGHNQSKGDLNVRLRAFCGKGQKPLRLATWPLKGKRGPQGPPGTARTARRRWWRWRIVG